MFKYLPRKSTGRDAPGCTRPPHPGNAVKDFSSDKNWGSPNRRSLKESQIPQLVLTEHASVRKESGSSLEKKLAKQTKTQRTAQRKPQRESAQLSAGQSPAFSFAIFASLR